MKSKKFISDLLSIAGRKDSKSLPKFMSGQSSNDDVKVEAKNTSTVEVSDKKIRFWLMLPKEYGIKLKLIQSYSKIDLKGNIRDVVLTMIDQAWERNKSLIQSSVEENFK